MSPFKLRAALSIVVLSAVGLWQAQLMSRAMAEPAATVAQDASALAKATFASGCFWCAESDFEKLDGVVSAVSGYTGGTTPNPTYEQVGQGGTGHAEAVEVTFDPAKVSYQTLVDYYFRHTDVLDSGGQFCDRGDQYRPAIFVHGAEQKKIAAEAKVAIEKSGRFKEPVAVQLADASTFTPAEDYHQDYYKKNPIKYNFYRKGCGRDARLKALWGSDYGH